jgi:hypothetical protein
VQDGDGDEDSRSDDEDALKTTRSSAWRCAKARKTPTRAVSVTDVPPSCHALTDTHYPPRAATRDRNIVFCDHQRRSSFDGRTIRRRTWGTPEPRGRGRMCTAKTRPVKTMLGTRS